MLWRFLVFILALLIAGPAFAQGVNFGPTGGATCAAATAGTLGCVKPDGSSITITGGGTISSSGGTPANPTATIGTAATNGVATTFMRSDAAPAAPACSASTLGLCKVDNVTITAAGGVITAANGSSAANPSATIGTAANNGVAATFMRSDASPAAPQCSNTTFGLCKVDNSTITASGGVISGTAVGTSGAVVGLLNANKTDSGNNIITGRSSEVPCAVVATSGTITLDLSTCGIGGESSDIWHLGPLTGTTTILFTNPAAGQVVRLEIAVNGQVVNLPSCIGPTLIAPTGNSFVVYDVFDTTPTYWCPSGVQANLVLPNPSIVQSNFVGGTSSGTTSQAVNLTNFAAGHVGYVLIGWCGTNACAIGAENITTVTATGGSCTLITGTNSGVGVPLPVAMYRCTGVSAGTATFTVNWGAGAFFQNVVAVEVNNDTVGVEAGAVNNGSSTSPSVTSGTFTQSNGELALSYAFAFNNTTNVAGPFTFVATGSEGFAWLSVSSCSSCTEVPVFTSGNGTWTAAIAGIKHS